MSSVTREQHGRDGQGPPHDRGYGTSGPIAYSCGIIGRTDREAARIRLLLDDNPGRSLETRVGSEKDGHTMWAHLVGYHDRVVVKWRGQRDTYPHGWRGPKRREWVSRTWGGE